jgi:alanyl-tRNA synthetase
MDVSAAATRQSFLDFFQSKGHRVVPSAPCFPQDDPTLLFTNAGMNQFKDVFLGTGTREYKRATDTQKCIRVQGKHNDLEEVGVDTYHHTFFEMIGNWSFGDYFKKESIAWAWELLTEVWQLPKERLWVTVFSGDETDGLAADEDAENLWKSLTDIDPTHILRFDRRDNFWEMGETGPCGPCSEIHIDRGAPGSDPKDGADPDIGVNAGNERFIELWNLVFMQFNRLDDGSLVPLPAPCVDTGMGFERVLAVLQGKLSNYDTDLFQPIFRSLETRTGLKYEDGVEDVDVAFRVCADHVRAVCSALADGALPSNEGRGYVIRRLIRRASRYGLQTLGMQEPFLVDIVPAVAEILGGAFPEIAARVDHVQLIMRSEEESFRKTLERGLVQFEKLSRDLKQGDTLVGGPAYELYATYGFPQDLVELMCREAGMQLDNDGWEAARKAHSEISKSDGKFKQLLSAEQLAGLNATDSNYFGAPGETVSTQIERLFPDDGRGERLVLSSSPFYPEGGGQVGDCGVIASADGDFEFEVRETQRSGEIIVHLGTSKGRAVEGGPVTATIDSVARDATMANHTATHLLHKALREVLGDHVTQQGSYVGPDRLRFDFSQPKGLSPEQLADVENRVSEAILRNGSIQTTEESFDAACERGVTALFGEKYGDTVRVVDVDGWSMELCGGTHVNATGDIGPFVILTERAIQAGVRRIEAITHRAALAYLRDRRQLLSQVAGALKAPVEEVPERISALQQQVKEAKKKAKAASAGDAAASVGIVKAALVEMGGIQTAVLDLPDHDANSLRDLAGGVKSLAPDLVVVLTGRAEGKVPFLCLCAGAAQGMGLKAGDLAKRMAGHLGGGGGGRPDVAQGQGQDPAAVETALADAKAYLTEVLG